MKGPQRLPLDAAAVARFARRPALARHFLYFSNEVEAARARAASGAAHASLHGIPIVENVFVARALYAATRPGNAVPPELYAAVAEIVAELMREGRLA